MPLESSQGRQCPHAGRMEAGAVEMPRDCPPHNTRSGKQSHDLPKSKLPLVPCGTMGPGEGFCNRCRGSRGLVGCLVVQPVPNPVSFFATNCWSKKS